MADSNWLLTGPPRSGKTTVVERVIGHLEDDGYTIGGMWSPEIRQDGARTGFALMAIQTGTRRMMASTDVESGPRVGKYHVDIEAIDHIVETVFDPSRPEVDLMVVDEIAPMECLSDTFVTSVTAVLDSDRPLLGTIHYRITDGFIGAVKDREDVRLIEVTNENRDELPARLTTEIGRLL